MQVGEGGVGADEQAAPDQGADPPQYDPQLEDGRGWGWNGFGHGAILARRLLGRRGEPPADWSNKPNRITALALASHGFSRSPRAARALASGGFDRVPRHARRLPERAAPDSLHPSDGD